MGARRIRRDQRQLDQKQSRLLNGRNKVKETARREQRILGLVKKQGKLPYTRAVMNWLSARLDKPATRIVQADVDKLLT